MPSTPAIISHSGIKYLRLIWCRLLGRSEGSPAYVLSLTDVAFQRAAIHWCKITSVKDTKLSLLRNLTNRHLDCLGSHGQCVQNFFRVGQRPTDVRRQSSFNYALNRECRKRNWI